MKAVVFLTYPLSEDKDRVYLKRKTDTYLVNAANNRKSKLMAGKDKDRTEVFQQDDNILITEIGYIVAVYETATL